MSNRRTYLRARRGQVYCIEWPEWHVECAKCGHSCHISACGEIETVAEADKRMHTGKVEDSTTSGLWMCKNGLWHCPNC